MEQENNAFKQERELLHKQLELLAELSAKMVAIYSVLNPNI